MLQNNDSMAVVTAVGVVSLYAVKPLLIQFDKMRWSLLLLEQSCSLEGWNSQQNQQYY
jgi:hypothetical protein